MSILGCSKSQAEQLIKNFYDGNSGLRKLLDNLDKFYKKHKYIKAIDGRRLYIRSSHVLLNSLIQASSAIIFKKWSALIWKYIDEYQLDAKIIILYHDECELRVHEDHVDKTIEVIQMALQKTKDYYKIRVPLATESKTGYSWASVH